LFIIHLTQTDIYRSIEAYSCEFFKILHQKSIKMENFMTTKIRKMMIVAGEASGDAHAAKVVKAIQTIQNNIYFMGFGGKAMRDAGVHIVIDSRLLSVVGITEVFSKAHVILKALKTAKKMIRTLRPDLLMLIDFPDFNFRLAKTAKQYGVPVLYYISPQLWAWRSGRVKFIKENVDHMAVILPFEAPFYETHHVPVTYVGHPLMDSLITLNHHYHELTIGIMPGSREGEVIRLLPIMAKAADQLSALYPGIRFMIPVASSLDPSFINNILNQQTFIHNPIFQIINEGVTPIFQTCKLAIVASGTATLETALHQLPMIIVYKISRASYILGRLLINVPHIGLANLVAGDRVVPELVQYDATPENIVNEASRILDNPKVWETMKRKLKMIPKRLGPPGASFRTAEIARRLINQ